MLYLFPMRKAPVWVVAVAFISIFSTQISFAAITPGTKCSKIGSAAISGGKKYTCIKSGKKLVWNKGVVIPKAKATPTPTPTPSSAPTPDVATGSIPSTVSGGICKEIGSKVTNEYGYLECREVAEGKKVYFQLINNIPDLPSVVSPENFESCRAPEMIKNKLDIWNRYSSIAYPVVKSTLNPIGRNRYLFVPIDFQDAPGIGSPSIFIEPELKKIKEWLKWYSNGKAEIEIDSSSSWIRSSKLASELITFRDPGNPTNVQGLLSDKKLIEALLTDAGKAFKLENYQGVYFIPPKSAKSLEHGVFINNTFNLPNSTFTGGGYIYANTAFEREEEIWAFIMHDFLHSFGLALHAPDQFLPFGLQSAQDAGLTINEWDSMSLGWTNPGDVFCISIGNLTKSVVTLAPIEREQMGVQSVMIRLAPSKVLVIESHRQDKWGSKFKDGFYGVTTYLVDTSVQNDPSKLDSPTTRFANYIENPNTKHGKLLNRRFYEEISASGVRTFGWITQPTWSLDYVLYEGESLTTNGVKITLIKSGDNDTISVERAN